jgi:superfamily II DNA or RNA helicase
MRPYQETIVNDIINNFGIQTPYVLGSCPSSGKTEMAIEAMIRLIESGQVNRVLILAHSTNVLKENFYQRLMEYFDEGDTIDVMRGQKNYNYDAKIQVMIPQNINHVIGQFDLIITDEAQHNVLAEDGNYSRIVEMVEPKFQLLLTGTPSKFVRQNDLSDGELPYHINCAGMDMIGFLNFHDVRFDLIKSAYGFTNEDYNQTQDIASDTKFSFAETERTINNVIIGAVMNIAKRNGINLPKDSNFIAEGRKLVKSGKFGKTLIMCRNIEQADQVADIISKLFKVIVRVSHSGNDGESKELDNFKAGKFEFLCVVNRAREGYDDKKVVNLIDITMTHNIDLIYQMFCRVVRKDVNNHNTKLYLKVTSNAEGMPEYTMNIMTAALMLGSTENLSRFNGSNFRGIVMPRIEREPDDEEDEIPVVNGVVDVVGEDGNTIRRRNISELIALDLVQMFSVDTEDLIHGNERYAMTTLGTSLTVLGGEVFLSPEETIQLCVTNNLISITPFNEFRGRNQNLKLRSTPWKELTISVRDYFNRIKDILGINYDYLSIEETFQLCVNNELTTQPKYNKFSEENDKYNLHSNIWLKIVRQKKNFSQIFEKDLVL